MTKRKPKSEHKKDWRPLLINKDTVAKLETFFSYWFTDAETCLQANISTATLYRYIQQNPEFWVRKDDLKNKPKMKAKLNILEKINNKDIDTSKRYLERKAKDEFSTKQEIDNTLNITDYTFTSNLEDDKKKLKK